MTKFCENKQKKEKSAFFFEILCIKVILSAVYGIFFVILCQNIIMKTRRALCAIYLK